MNRIVRIFKIIVPSRERFNRWTMISRVIYLSSVGALIIPLILFFYNILFVESRDFYKIQKTTNEGDIVIINQDNRNQKSHNTIYKGRLSEFGNDIFDSLDLKLDKDLIIDIDFTGNFKEISKDYKIFNYSGGNFSIKINSCFLNFTEISIPSLGPAPKENLIETIKELLSKKIISNKDRINNKARICF